MMQFVLLFSGLSEMSPYVKVWGFFYPTRVLDKCYPLVDTVYWPLCLTVLSVLYSVCL